MLYRKVHTLLSVVVDCRCACSVCDTVSGSLTWWNRGNTRNGTCGSLSPHAAPHGWRKCSLLKMMPHMWHTENSHPLSERSSADICWVQFHLGKCFGMKPACFDPSECVQQIFDVYGRPCGISGTWSYCDTCPGSASTHNIHNSVVPPHPWPTA